MEKITFVRNKFVSVNLRIENYCCCKWMATFCDYILLTSGLIHNIN